MKKTFITSFILLMSTLAGFAQDDFISVLQTQSNSYEGKIEVQQDAQLTQLLQNHIALNQFNESKTEGWRVQIHSSSNRAEAEAARVKFMQSFPNYPTYFIYQPPMFKIRVGDFRTREDAFMLYKQTVKLFNVSYVINDQILFPKL
ncbi:MAG: SPOR domain-containing protein [Bacteroidetes bacterium]|nr:SPOR domain-containing protein [Bacteroidota bacterium]